MKNEKETLKTDFLRATWVASDHFLARCSLGRLFVDDLVSTGKFLEAALSILPKEPELRKEFLAEGLFLIYKEARDKKNEVINREDYPKFDSILNYKTELATVKYLKRNGFKITSALFNQVKSNMAFELADANLGVEHFKRIAEELNDSIIPSLTFKLASLRILLALIIWNIAIHGFASGGVEF